MGKNKAKSKFKHTWASLTDIGAGFGLSAAKKSSWRQLLGLQGVYGTPAPATLEERLGKPSKRGHYRHDWSQESIDCPVKDSLPTADEAQEASDPASIIAREVHKLIQLARRFEAKGNGEMAEVSYGLAREHLRIALRKTENAERLYLAVDVHKQVLALMEEGYDLKFLYQRGPVQWEQVSARLLEDATPKNDAVAARPRL